MQLPKHQKTAIAINFSLQSAQQCHYVQLLRLKFAMGAVLRVLGRSPQPSRHGGLGAEPQRSKILHFFARTNLILGIFC